MAWKFFQGGPGLNFVDPIFDAHFLRNSTKIHLKIKQPFMFCEFFEVLVSLMIKILTVQSLSYLDLEDANRPGEISDLLFGAGVESAAAKADLFFKMDFLFF
jgi:hypothetical protein